MSSLGDWEVPPSVQPKPEDYTFDLDEALASVVGVRAHTSSDAFTAETLGDERLGTGVLLPGGFVLTIGYLIVDQCLKLLPHTEGSYQEIFESRTFAWVVKICEHFFNLIAYLLILCEESMIAIYSRCLLIEIPSTQIRVAH